MCHVPGVILCWGHGISCATETGLRPSAWGNTIAEQEQGTDTTAVSLRAIDLKGAVKVARNFFVDTFSDDEDLTNLHFEEIERADNGDWLITFGYDRETNNALARLGLPGNLTERVYRQVRIDGYTSEALAVKIRAV